MLCISLSVTGRFFKGGIQKQRLAVAVPVNFSFRIFSIIISHIPIRKPIVCSSEITSCSRTRGNGTSQGRYYTNVSFGNKRHIFFGVVAGVFLTQTISATLLTPLPLRELHRTSWRAIQRKGIEQYGLQASQINIHTRGNPL